MAEKQRKKHSQENPNELVTHKRQGHVIEKNKSIPDDEAINKVIHLFEYIKDLVGLKHKIVTDINNQQWSLYLDDIEGDDNIYIANDVYNELAEDGYTLLRVHKVELEKCPEPPQSILGWLKSGWNNYREPAEVYDSTLSNEDDSEENFEDDEKRVADLSEWLEKREKWVQNQKEKGKARKLFQDLYDKYTDLKRDSDTLELMIGNGFLSDNSNPEIKHPILLKKVGLSFDAERNEISIIDLDLKPEIYIGLLQKIDGLNTDVIPDANNQLDDNEYHPLDNEETKDFLKRLMYKLSSESAVAWENSDNIQTKEDRLLIEWKPVFFIRNKIDGTYRAIDDIIKNIEETHSIPKHILDLVGFWENKENEEIDEYEIDELLARSCGESEDILLAKEANKEQLQIAERISNNNAVVVQGPPGTGKTHTIANLIGHFLAEGKSVLVTSHKEKALRVLKEKLPKEIQNLCVSLLDDSNRDMVKAVEGISDYISNHSSQLLKNDIIKIERERNEIIKELSAKRKEIYAAKYKELDYITYNGYSYSVIDISKFVSDNEEELSEIIPGSVEETEFIFSEKELRELYHSNSLITSEEEKEIIEGLPDPDNIVKPKDLLDYLTHKKECVNEKKAIEKCINESISFDWSNRVILLKNGDTFAPLKDCNELEELPNDCNFNEKELTEWQLRAIYDGKLGAAHKDIWIDLEQKIKDTISFEEETTKSLLGKTIHLENSDGDYIGSLKKMKDKFLSKGKLGRIDLLNKAISNTNSEVSINGEKVSSAEDCQSVIDYISLNNKRKELHHIWDELIVGDETVKFENLGETPERSCARIIGDVNVYLEWYNKFYNRTFEILEASGINTNVLKRHENVADELAITKSDINTVVEIIPRLVKLVLDAYNACLEKSNIDKSIQYIDGFDADAKCVSVLKEHLIAGKADLYKNDYDVLKTVYNKREICSRRKELLEKVSNVAPEWADAISNREGIHGETMCPAKIEDAWKWKQFDLKIRKILECPVEDLQKQAISLSKELRYKTEKLAAAKAWYHLLCRIESNLNMQQALNGWKLSIKKVGKGTGKNAAKNKRIARNKMKDCQDAVPAWIMPIGKALDSFNAQNNAFDIVIVDEASQSDVSALAVLYLAEKVVIVGDDQQVSPMSIGTDDDEVRKLIDMHIKGQFANDDLYEPKTSLYDIATTTFQPLMLKEHFRCVPDIIGYSNKLSYDGKIKPLRDAGGCNIVPAVVPYRVNDGYRNGKQKINSNEAKSIVALIAACIEQEEYENESIGVISLLGSEQGRLIQEELVKCLDASVIEKHNILCGDAANFQGDERDVVFLSMVDSREGEGPIRLKGEGSGQSIKQRYNVAVSRARNQIWVVNSLDFANDLKQGDIRRDLLEYANNPGAFKYKAEEIKSKSDSPFEEEVANRLLSKGYNIEQQHEVGAYRIDIIAKCGDKSIAIECDGEAYHSTDEQVRNDMERQNILERLDWRFIRIRGCEFFRNKNETMERVYDELEGYGIYPESSIDKIESSEEPELLRRVKARANEILLGWEEKGDINEIELEKHSITTEKNNPEKKKRIKKEEENNKEKEKRKNEIANKNYAKKDNRNEERKEHKKSRKKPLPDQMTIMDIKSDSKKREPSIKKNDNDNSKAKNEFRKKEKREPNFLIEHLLDELKEKGLKILDNRKKSGLIWVVLEENQKDKDSRGEIVQLIESHGYKCGYEARGALITNGKPALRVNIEGSKKSGKR